MKQSKTPLWKKSCLDDLSLWNISDWLQEISENGDMHSYDGGQDGYYQEYKDLFDDLSDMAYRLSDATYECGYVIEENWDDMTVALLGDTHSVLGFDTVEQDYFQMVCGYDEDSAVKEAEKRIMRLTKSDMVRTFKKVLGTLLAFYDIKTAHDCLTAIVDELDEKGAILERKNQEINRLYEDVTAESSAKLDAIIKGISPYSRMWVE